MEDKNKVDEDGDVVMNKKPTNNNNQEIPNLKSILLKKKNNQDPPKKFNINAKAVVVQPKQSVDYTKRIMTSVSPPKPNCISSEKLFSGPNDTINIKLLKRHLSEEGKLYKEDAKKIISLASKIFKKEANLLQLKDPITVCGDVHGQYFDLLKLLQIGGDPKKNKYLFLGDYVDRGCFGTEVCFLLMSYKILYPNNFFMIRGNHECRHLTAYFNFKQECLFKYDLELYNCFMDCFDCLPLGALLNGRFICVHGGLSPKLSTIDQINSIDRFREPPSNGIMCDILWSDPMDDEEEETNGEKEFVHNELRGCSFVFSYKAVNNFLQNNNLLSVIRAHEAQDDGYRLYKSGSNTKFPTVICIFSAPNYCDVYNNKGAIIRFQNNLMNIRQFNYSTHPYYLPNFMNAFNWSLPFVVEKVMDMFNVILNLVSDDEEDDEDDEDDEEGKGFIGHQQAESIKNKIRSLGRIARMYETLRKEQESIVALKGLAGGKIPTGLLFKGPKAIKSAVKDFESAMKFDRGNEKRPPMKIISHETSKENLLLINKMKKQKIRVDKTGEKPKIKLDFIE